MLHVENEESRVVSQCFVADIPKISGSRRLVKT